MNCRYVFLSIFIIGAILFIAPNGWSQRVHLPKFESEIIRLVENGKLDSITMTTMLMQDSFQESFCKEQVNPTVMEDICQSFQQEFMECCHTFWKQRFQELEDRFHKDRTQYFGSLDDLKVREMFVFEDFSFEETKLDDIYPYQLYLTIQSHQNFYVLEMDVTFYKNSQIFQYDIDGIQNAKDIIEYIHKRSANEMIESQPPSVDNYLKTLMLDTESHTDKNNTSELRGFKK